MSEPRIVHSALPEEGRPLAGRSRPARLGRLGTWLVLVRGQPIIWLVAALALFFVFLTLIIIRDNLQPTRVDVALTLQIQLLPAWLGRGLTAISDPGFFPWNYLLPGGVVVALALGRAYIEAGFAAMAAVGGLLSEVVKVLVDRPRPNPDLVHVATQLHTYSFPSGHAAGYVTFYGFVFYLAYTLLSHRSTVRRISLIVLGLFIALVGISRVYMGQHWFSDVIGGYALGFAWLLIVIELYRAVIRRRAALPPTTAGP